jgi:hypothetical protein
MLQEITVHYQRLPVVVGNSTRHSRDMQPTKILETLDRVARIHILGIAGLLDQSKHPAHRPKTVDSPLLRDEIAQAVFYCRALNPTKSQKQIVGGVGDLYGVSRSYVYEVLSKVDAARKENIQAGAAVVAELYGRPKKSTT